MLSRIFWIGLAGIAIVAGMIFQGGGRVFGWADDHSDMSGSTKRALARSVDQAVERGFHKMEVVGPDGRQIHVSPETKRALAAAVGRLVKAKTDLAFLRAGDASNGEIAAAEARSDQARAAVDLLQAEIREQGQAGTVDQDALRKQMRQEVRDQVRAAVRETVGN